jgi:hypothetical protein
VVESAIIEIQALADGLDSPDTTKLTYDLKAEKDAIRSGTNLSSITGMGREIDQVCQIGSQGR